MTITTWRTDEPPKDGTPIDGKWTIVGRHILRWSIGDRVWITDNGVAISQIDPIQWREIPGPFDVVVAVPETGPEGECSIYCEVMCPWSVDAKAGPGCPRYKEHP